MNTYFIKGVKIHEICGSPVCYYSDYRAAKHRNEAAHARWCARHKVYAFA